MATTITFPNTNTTIQGVWNVTATSNDTNLTGINFSINGVSVFIDNTAPYVYEYDTTLANNQNVNITATSIRSSGLPTTDTNVAIINNPKPVQFPTTQDVNVTNATLEVQSSPIPGAISDLNAGQFFGIAISLALAFGIVLLLVKRYSPRSRR